MPMLPLVPTSGRLELRSLALEGEKIILIVRTCGDHASCPRCGQPSARVHSHYHRTLADLPWAGIPTHISLWSRRFFCDTADCPRRVFTERLPGVAAPHAHRTDRLRDWLVHTAFALGGKPGARLLRQLGIPVCGSTLLSYLRAQTLPAGPTPRIRILSVDDFAFRRGCTYGSILVDLERHQVIDLLPDRSGTGFAAWLTAHPGVELLSRDRSSEYAAAARHAAPQACQIADRFHLLRNLRDVVWRVFKRHAKLVERVVAPGPAGPVGCAVPSLTRLRLDREGTRERTRAEMAARFTAIQRFVQEGMSQAAIARTLGLNWQTVHKYAAYATPPERRHTSRQPSVFTPYQGYLLGRWASGCRNARQLWRELVAHGYPGSYRHVARLTGYLRHQERMGAGLPSSPSGMTPAQATGLVVARPEKRTADENAVLERLGKLHPEMQVTLTLFASFAALVRERSPAGPASRVEEWLAEARASPVPELAAFAVKLRQDLEAVLASFTLPYSQGQTEGQVNRLKLLKRSMYGRAKLDLLRQRMLQNVVG